MNVFELSGPSLDALRPATRATPEPGAGEVLVRLRAASLNFLDVAIATGNYPGATFPLVPVADGAGEVAATGDGVDAWRVGDRVIPHFMPDWIDGALSPESFRRRRGVTMQGSLAEFCRVPARSLARVPDHLSFAQAACLPIAATTAWRACRAARLGPHSTALVIGTGVVALFALQFARAHGARVIVTSSSDEKIDRARRLGASDGINYRRTPEWQDEARRLTDGRGVDLVLETGGRDTFPRSIEASAINGTLFVIGFLTGTTPTIDVLKVMEKQLRIVGNNTGPVADFADACVAIAAHAIVPTIDRTFAMRDAAAAYAHASSSGKAFGKIVIDVG